MQPAALFDLLVADFRIKIARFLIVLTGLFDHRQHILFARWQGFLEVLVVEMPFRVGSHDGFSERVIVGMTHHGIGGVGFAIAQPQDAGGPELIFSIDHIRKGMLFPDLAP